MIYLFNPEHDYALANNGKHFVPPLSAVKFAQDCAPFLRYLINPDDIIFQPYQDNERFLSATGLAGRPMKVEGIRPWGWDALVLQQLRSEGFCHDVAWDGYVHQVHALAHRRTAGKAIAYLQQTLPADFHMPMPAQEITSVQEAEDFIRQYQDVLFKSPYSGNGRGHLYAHGKCSPTLARQLTGVIRRQGSVMAEPMYHLIQDFAMEFLCDDSQTRFAGYSLFETQHYGYGHNVLCSDKQIEETLEQWVDHKQLEMVKEALVQFINKHIAPSYSGFLGVDMCIFEDKEIRLHPMIEINLRMTMGMVAHLLYERHLHPQATGTLHLVYRNKGLEPLIHEMEKKHPWVMEDGLWRAGFKVLHPVDPETQYAICVLLT